MSDFSQILEKIRSNLLEAGIRYKVITTTSAGAAGGTTFISTDMDELDDAWNTAEATVLAGDADLNGLKRVVEDFAASSDTATLTNNPFPKQVGNGLTIRLSEPGIWGIDDLKRYIVQAANYFLRKAVDLNVNYTIRETIGGVLGVCDLPDSVMKFVQPIAKLDGVVVSFLSPNRAAMLDENPYLNVTAGTPIGYFVGRESDSEVVGQLLYKPAVNGNIVFNYVPVALFDTTDNWKVPDEAWDAISAIATGYALQANERPDLANMWIRMGLGYLPQEKTTEEKIREKRSMEAQTT